MQNSAKNILDDSERFRLVEQVDEQKPKENTSVRGNLRGLHFTTPGKDNLPEVKTDTTVLKIDADGIIRGNS